MHSIIASIILRRRGGIMTRRLISVGYLRLIILQLVLVSFVSLVLFFVAARKDAYSAFLGGLICIIPGAVFAINVFWYRGARSAKKIVARMYWGEALKLSLSFLFFTLVFIFIPISGIPFFLTFISTQLLYWLAPFVLKL